MKNIIICGSRSIEDADLVYNRLYRYAFLPWATATIMHGGAPGVDTIADYWVRELFDREPEIMRPHYYQTANKRYAPIARNEEMAKRAAEHGGGYVVALWDGRIDGSGTGNMILNGHKYGLTVYVEVVT